MKLAILLGVSEYETQNPLPACKEDMNLMSKLVKATTKYDSLLCISENTNAAEVKEKITNRIHELKGKEIEEIFFYYTGHGHFFDNEFYYVLSDFDKKKIKQTSLENSELDSWLRSLDAGMIIKVVDACNSGIMYVKDDSESLLTYLNQSKKELEKEFKKCYFMFSSRLDESSYVNEDTGLSHFTESFLDAFRNQKSKEIRYKDIMDFISDSFVSKPKQTPFFVIQADLTERFCLINKKISELFSLDTSTSRDDIDKKEPKTLISIIEADAKSYFTKDQAFQLLDEIKTTITNYEYSTEFLHFFGISSSFIDVIDDEEIPELKLIGRWLNDNDHNLFAEVETENVQLKNEIPKNSAANKLFAQSLYDQLYAEKKYKTVVTGFFSTIDCPYEVIKIEAEPKFPNLPWNDCIIVFLLSKTEIRFFYSFIVYKDTNWDEVEISEKVKWFTTAYGFKDKKEIFKGLNQILIEYEGFIIKKLNEKFGIISEDEKSAQEEDDENN